MKCFNVDSSDGLKFLTRIRIGLSHLADHKFRCNFQYCINPVCSCGQETEISTHSLAALITIVQDKPSLKKYKKIDSSILNQNDQVITKLLLFGNEKLKAAQNKSILTSRT